MKDFNLPVQEYREQLKSGMDLRRCYKMDFFKIADPECVGYQVHQSGIVVNIEYGDLELLRVVWAGIDDFLKARYAIPDHRRSFNVVRIRLLDSKAASKLINMEVDVSIKI